MMDTVWIALGGNVAFVAVVAYLGKSLVTQWLGKDLEQFKSELRAAVDVENERLRSSLQIAAAEHSILLTRLQDRRATVIGEIYALLAKAIAATTSYVHIAEWRGEPSKEEKSRVAFDAIVAFRDEFDQKRIWLPAECCERLDALSEALRKLYMDFSFMRGTDGKRSPDNDGWFKLWEDASKNLVPPARQALEENMRALLDPRR